MANLIPLEQAAAMLGMTVEQLTELRSNNEVFGYRDGASWKFKKTELERVAADLDIELNLGGVSATGEKIVDKPAVTHHSDELDFDSADGSKMTDEKSIPDDESSADYVSDESSDNLIQDDSSSEIFSRPLSAGSEADDSEIDLSASDDSFKIEDSSDSLKLHSSGSDVIGSEEDDDLSFGSSSLSLAAESSKKLTGDSGDLLDDDESGKDSPSDTGKMAGEEDLLLAEDDLFSDELEIGESESFEDSAELSSDFEDSDLVMEDSDSSTEIALEANDSGINLSPNESGILLDEEPLELGGSDIDSLELPEDDDDIIMLDDPADPEQATLMQEDDFNLTPLEEAIDDESSGSQVIALEDSEIYTDESSATVLAESSDLGEQPAMLDDTMGMEGDAYGVGLAPVGVAGVGAAGPAALPEAPYSVYQVISLGLVAALLCVGAMIGYDLARNLWMSEDQIVNSGVLKFFLDMVGMG